MGGALEEGLKSRARAMGIEIGERETLNPLIVKLKSPEAQVFNEFETKHLEALARIRNDAAHGGEFNYSNEQVTQALDGTRATLEKILRQR
jgi:hypothetical protein